MITFERRIKNELKHLDQVFQRNKRPDRDNYFIGKREGLAAALAMARRLDNANRKLEELGQKRVG